ncbi:hypothetical protein Pfo_020237 [Paulownia fortunei]|nr:hypothetical protein Pfo_020237 [Paulownia fortunei]
MAAFSSFQHHHPFQLLDSSAFLPNSTPSTINKMCALLEEPDNASPCFSQIYQHGNLQNLDQSTKVSALGNNEASVLSVTNKNSMDSSSILTDKYYDSSGQVTQKATTPMDRKRRCKEGSSANCAQSKDMREVKGKKQKKMKDCEEKKKSKDEKKAAETAPTGYIHVRARRGQATDSHSLAERVRRERISERMKLLQALVPGCDKVTGKALMLDEIINYVQSLQNQVEFLSMKLASVNPMFYDFGMDLESFMVRPDQNLSSLPSPLPGMQECSPTTANAYPLLDNSANSLLLQQAQIPSDLPQGHRQVLWEVDDQRQNIINQSGINSSLFSFH